MDLQPQSQLKSKELALVYHHLFEYPLSKNELNYWSAGAGFYKSNKPFKIEVYKNNFYLKGSKKIVDKKIKRKKISAQKKVIAKRGAKVIAFLPSVEFVGVTGSLAMDNCKASSDIDLIVICAPNSFWASRILVLLLLKISKVRVRKAGRKAQRDLICLNMWMESDDLEIREKNIYTAHELLQIEPLVDKSNSLKKLIKVNKWAGEYWPKAYENVILSKVKKSGSKHRSFGKPALPAGRLGMKAVVCLMKMLNIPLYILQYLYMRPKITNEQVNYKRAFFHPQDGSAWVERRLAKYGVVPVDS